MKVSQNQKRETRRQLVDAAADLFVQQGIDKTSMKQIAREAGVGDATVYKYFPNKDKLIVGFYELRGEQAITIFRQTPGLADYNFAEKCQLLVDTWLEQLLRDREFVALSLEQLLKSPLSLLKDELAVAQAYKSLFLELLAEAESSDNYPEIPMHGVVASLLTDYLLGLTLYWIKDDSEEFLQTTQLTDLSLTLIDQLLRSGVLTKTLELVGFLIKAHLVRGLSNAGGVMALLQEFSSTMNQHIAQNGEKTRGSV